MPKFNSLGIDYKKVLKGPHARMLVGQVRGINKGDNTRKVACLKLSLDPKLMKHWNVRRLFRAADHNDSSKFGDIVVISQLPKPDGYLITHKVDEVLYKSGAVVDPITGKTVRGRDYNEQTTNPNFEKWLERKRESEALESEV